MIKLCAILTCSFALLAGFAQSRSFAQGAQLDSARPRYGNPSQQQQPQADSQSVPPGGPQQQWANAPQYAPVVADPGTPLGVGDMVTFSIAEDRDPAVKLRVTDSGELDIPYAGRVRALGKTVDSVASEAKRVLEARYYYKATVKLGIDQRALSHSLGKVYLTGLVRTPGPQDLYPGEKLTVSAAIVKAGGFAQFADTGHIKVTRKKKNGQAENYSIDVGAVLKKGRLEKDLEVQDGDFIYVPQKAVNF